MTAGAACARYTRRAAAVALLLAAVALAGCGQRGPLTLPASAQPVKRLPPGAQAQPPAAEPQPQAVQPSRSSQPPTPPRQDDRTENER